MAGFGNNTYATLWEIENKGKYSQARATVSQKVKDGVRAFGPIKNGYETVFVGNVKLVGTAHTMAQAFEPGKGIRVKIANCSITGGYKYTKQDGTTAFAPYQFTIFGLETGDGSSAQKKKAEKSTKPKYNNYPDDDGGMPFD